MIEMRAKGLGISDSILSWSILLQWALLSIVAWGSEELLKEAACFGRGLGVLWVRASEEYVCGVR